IPISFWRPRCNWSRGCALQRVQRSNAPALLAPVASPICRTWILRQCWIAATASSGTARTGSCCAARVFPRASSSTSRLPKGAPTRASSALGRNRDREAAACNQPRLDRKYGGRGCGPDHRENDHEESARFTLGNGHMRLDPDPDPAQHRLVRAGRLTWTGYLQYPAGSTSSRE